MKNSIKKFLISGTIICAVVLLFAGSLNLALEAYANDKSASLRLEAEYAAKEKLVRDEINEFLGDEESAAKKYYDALALADALAAQEAYYNHYTKNNHMNTREQRDYHYYGQFYEMFNNVYNADVIFLGSSRAVYGVNPMYLEKNEDLSEYSFYNFSLNAAGPSYYLQWYDVFKNEAKHPLPDTVIYCVDWFMFDSGNWMWRKFDYDTVKGGALYEIRQTVKDRSIPVADTVESTSESETLPPITDLPTGETTPSEEKKEYKNLWELIVAWWNGDEKLDLSSLADWFTKEVSLFAEQKRIPDMISYYVSGEYQTASAQLVQKEYELKAKLAKLEAERDELLAGGTSDYPEVEIYDYYGNRDFRVDQDGNVSSKFYKGFIPWEFNYYRHPQGNGPEYNENQGAQYVEGLSETQVDAFKQLILQMQADGIEVIFVHLPDYAKVRPNGQIAEYTPIIDEIAAELGIEFLDYNSLTSERGSYVADYKRYFSNWNHLNEIGAKKFTEILAEDLAPILNKD